MWKRKKLKKQIGKFNYFEFKNKYKIVKSAKNFFVKLTFSLKKLIKKYMRF